MTDDHQRRDEETRDALRRMGLPTPIEYDNHHAHAVSQRLGELAHVRRGDYQPGELELAVAEMQLQATLALAQEVSNLRQMLKHSMPTAPFGPNSHPPGGPTLHGGCGACGRVRRCGGPSDCAKM